MSDPMPAEVAVTEQCGGVHYRLPSRQLGMYRLAGLGVLLVGLLLCAAPIFPLWKLAHALLNPVPADESFLWLGGVIIGITFLTAGMHILPVGLFILAGHSEIELCDGTLTAFECYGPIRWKWQRSANGLHRFFVSEGLETLNLFGKLAIGPLGTRCVITPEWKAVVDGPPSKPMWLAPGYPRPWLLALAQDLARRCGPAALEASAGAASAPLTAARIPVMEKEPDFSNYEELAEQPAGSKVAVEEVRQGLTLIVPALGARHGLHWFVGGSLVCVVAFGASQNIFADEKERIFSAVEATALVAAALWALGIGLLLAGANVARRRAVLAVVGDMLVVRQVSLFGTRRWQWRRQQVADVFVRHHPDSEAPDYWALEIHPRAGAAGALHLLAHRDPAELRWLATLLRQALRCPCDSPESPPAELVVQSPLLVLRARDLGRQQPPASRYANAGW